MTPEEEGTRHDRIATAFMLHALHNDRQAIAELAGQLDQHEVSEVVRILAIFAGIGYLGDFDDPEYVEWFLRNRLHHLALDDTGEAP